MTIDGTPRRGMGAVRHSPFPLKKKPFLPPWRHLRPFRCPCSRQFTFAEYLRYDLYGLANRDATWHQRLAGPACSYFVSKSRRVIPLNCAGLSFFLRPGEPPPAWGLAPQPCNDIHTNITTEMI